MIATSKTEASTTSTVVLGTMMNGEATAPAVIDGATTISHADLDRSADQVANGLIGLGLAPGDRVAFLGRNCLACVQLLFGATRAGMVVTMPNWRLHPRELRYVLDDSTAKVLVVTDEFAGIVHELRDELAVEHIVTVSAHGPTDHNTWVAWLTEPDCSPIRSRPAPSDVTVQLYTSGTTGRPKGAMLTHANFAATIPDTADVWQLDSASVVLSVLPMFHIAGIGTVLATLWAGGCLVIDNDPQPQNLLATVTDHGVTNLVLVSVLLQGILASPACDAADLSTLRTVSYGGSPISGQVLHDATAKLACRILQVYGLTETTGVLTVLDPADHDFDPTDELAVARLRSCGRPRPGVELRIVDPESGSPLSSGEVGEVQARTNRLMAGYWNLPEATEAALLPGGWFRTGDLAEIDPEGYLFLRDRLNDTIVSGGENIYPAEVEDALHWHPDVVEVAVVGVPDERWGETPHAVIVRRPGSAITEPDVMSFARDRLARYKCPTSAAFVEALPRNATGKVLRRELREPHWAGHTRRIH